jgi:hypothetical protein
MGHSLWRHRDFLIFWSGQTVSLFGSQVTLLALPLRWRAGRTGRRPPDAVRRRAGHLRQFPGDLALSSAPA